MTGDYRVFRADSTRAAFIEFVPALIAGLPTPKNPTTPWLPLIVSCRRSNAAGG